MAKPFDLQLFHNCRQIFQCGIPRYSKVAAGLLILVGGPLSVLAQNPAKTGSGPAYHSIEDFITVGLTENPAILAARARWEAALMEIPAKRALPDPSLGYVHYLESVETRVGPQQGALNISQRLPWLGKLRLEGRIGELKADVVYYQFLGTAQRVAAQIEDAYWDYYYLLQALDITEKNLELLRNWEQVVLSKYKAAQAGHPDIIKTQIEVLSLEDQLTGLQQRQRLLLERLSAATGRQLTAASITVKEPTVPEPALGIDSLLAMGFQYNPDLLGTHVAANLAETAVKRTRLNYLPDIMIGGNSIFTGKNPMLAADDPENGKDPLMISVGLSLPIQFRKYKSLEQSARIEQRSAEFLVRDKESQLRSQLELVFFELEDATRKVRLYKEALIPRAEQSLLTSEKAYIGDRVDFLTLIEAQRVLLNYQLSYQKALTEEARHGAQLKALLGLYSVNTSNSEEK
ncbi:TolC family protein [Candidatus Neomarinimicrobiota bacterium]